MKAGGCCELENHRANFLYDKSMETKPIGVLGKLQAQVEILMLVQVWQRWSDRPIDGSAESFVYAARFFPSLRLKR